MFVVAFRVYPVVDEVVEGHLVQPLDVEVFLVVLPVCFDVVVVDRWLGDVDVPFSVAKGRFEVDLGAMQICFDVVTFARGPLSPKPRFLGMLPIFIRRVVLGQESSIL